MGHKKNHFSEE